MALKGIYLGKNGYLMCSECKDGKTIHRYVHRVIWEETNGMIPEGFEIHHINHNRIDNRIENLQLISRSEHRRLHNPPLPKEEKILRRKESVRKTRAKNADKIKAYMTEYCKEYKKKNSDKIKARDSKYYAENKEQIKARARQYYQNHREECIARVTKRRMEKKNG